MPGNLVALCRNCNNKKLDLPPEEFYIPGELDWLKPIFDQHEDVFSFTFNWDAWHEDREAYLVSLGVEAGLVQELLTNPEPPDFVGTARDDVGFTITIDLHDLYKDENR